MVKVREMAPLRATGTADTPGPPPPARGVVPSSSACWDRVPLRGGFGSSLHAAGSEFGSQTNPILDPVSAELSFSALQSLCSEESPKRVQDLLSLGTPQPVSQRAVAGGISPRRVPRSSFRSEKCSAPGSPVDPQYLLSAPRSQVTETSEWEAVYSPSYQFSCEEDGALKSGSVQSHRRASDVSAAPH
jgi:hypothetical protein